MSAKIESLVEWRGYRVARSSLQLEQLRLVAAARRTALGRGAQQGAHAQADRDSRDLHDYHGNAQRELVVVFRWWGGPLATRPLRLCFCLWRCLCLWRW